jgi:tellurite methyltransferase
MARRRALSEDERRKWDERYSGDDYVNGHSASQFLMEHQAILPPSGRALDVAAGEGQNAVFLAERGLEVEAIDISTVGLRKAQQLAEQRGTSIKVRLWDIKRSFLPEGPFAVILCLHYMQRNLAPKIWECLAPNGLLFMELATLENLKLHKRPSREYLLERNELLTWFPDLFVIAYREGLFDGHAVAQLVGRRRATG